MKTTSTKWRGLKEILFAASLGGEGTAFREWLSATVNLSFPSPAAHAEAGDFE
jgi:hypothetical protein